MNNLTYEQFTRKRIDELRINKRISEYQLSLDLGHCQGYIQAITSGRNLPSMNSFFEICTYFDVEPFVFFDPAIKNPSQMNSIIEDIKKLNETDLLLLSTIIKRFLQLYPQ